jgi:predicted DNA-binding protein
MSREDPQLRIRLPAELKQKIEDFSKANGRSMNAEIVKRLEASFLGEIPEDEVISASQALQIASIAKDEISNIIFKRTFAEINEKARMGHRNFCISFNDLELDEISEDDFYHVLDRTLKKLDELGYIVPEKSIDGSGFLVDIPENEVKKSL